MYDTIKLEKSMYNLTGKSFSQALYQKLYGLPCFITF